MTREPSMSTYLISFVLVGFSSLASLTSGAAQRHAIFPTSQDLLPRSHSSTSDLTPSGNTVHSNMRDLGIFSPYRPDFSNLPMIGVMAMSVLGFLRSMSPYIMDNFKLTNRRKNFLVARHLKNEGLSSVRRKRDLAYAKDLLDLLISVEVELEKYGITDPQCQLRATCEIHRSEINEIKSKYFENFIRLISRMRSEIQNPGVVPLAKYVFEYYEESAIRGENNCDCQALYDKCPYSLDFFLKRTKGGRPRG